jgi:hypothetical protein
MSAVGMTGLLILFSVRQIYVIGGESTGMERPHMALV